MADSNLYNLNFAGKEKHEKLRPKVISDEERREKANNLAQLENEREQILTNKAMNYTEKTQLKKKLSVVSFYGLNNI